MEEEPEAYVTNDQADINLEVPKTENTESDEKYLPVRKVTSKMQKQDSGKLDSYKEPQILNEYQNKKQVTRKKSQISNRGNSPRVSKNIHSTQNSRMSQSLALDNVVKNPSSQIRKR